MQLSSLIYSKPDPVYVAARDILDQFRQKLDGNDISLKLNLPQKRRTKILKKVANSPWMTCYGKHGNLIVVEFPPFSEPYDDHLTNKVKECFIWDGQIFDANNPDMVFNEGKIYKIYPQENVMPYTKDRSAVAIITLQK